MKRMFWTVLAILVSTSVYFTIRYGLRPKPIPVINATSFENTQQIGAVILKRLLQNIRSERVIVLGSSTEINDYAGVWTGFLKTALADKIRVAAVYQFDGIATLEQMPGVQRISFGEAEMSSPEFLNAIRAKLKPGQLVIIHGPTSASSHLIKTSFSRALDKVLGHPVLSLSTEKLTIESDAQDELRENCEDLKSSNENEASMKCASARVSRQLVRKRLSPDLIWATMEQHGLQEYLVFIHNRN